VARKLNALPLSGREGLIRIAIADPTDVLNLDEPRMVADTPIHVVDSDASVIKAWLDRLYPPLRASVVEIDGVLGESD
jgi:hypothetical protein